MNNLMTNASKAMAALLVLSVAVATLTAVFSSAASSQSLHWQSAAACTSGSLVDQAANPRVAGDNNDLVEDCLALMELRELVVIFWPRSLQGWSDRTNSTDISDWTGVTVSNGRVTALNLKGHNLENDVDVGISYLGQLTALTSLDISNNNLQATIPASIGAIPNLATFAFCNNRLTGAVPVSLRTGVTLTDYPTSQGYNPVRCQQGQTSTSPPGSTPPSTTPPDPGAEATVSGAAGCFDGTYVSSSATRHSGQNNDLAEDCQNLIAVKNHWGSALDSWGSSETPNISDWPGVTVSTYTRSANDGRVRRLDLPSSSLSGTIPAAIVNLSALAQITLNNNQLSGTMPSGLGGLSELVTLNLSNNNLTGSIPSSLSNLSHLSTLNLSNNRLSGNIPTALNSISPIHNRIPGSEEGLDKLHICNNDLTGPLPSDLRTTRIDLVGYPRHQGYNPVQCQRGQTITPPPSTTTTTTTTVTPDAETSDADRPAPTQNGQTQSGASHNLISTQMEYCISGPILQSRGIREPGPNNDLVDDCLALLEFRENSVLYWPRNLRGWTGRSYNTPLSSWTGVTISNGRVTALNLRGHNLDNDIDFGLGPLGKLTALTILDISNNQLAGSIPASIGNIPNLSTFAFCNNRLSGSVPASLRSGVNLVNYPTSQGYSPVRCQLGQSNADTPTTIAPRRGESSYNLLPFQMQRCISGPNYQLIGSRVPGPNNDLVDDCLAILEFRENTVLAWPRALRGWNGRTNNLPISEWRGVTVQNGRVTALNIAGYDLQSDADFGFGPLGKLTALTILDISDNELQGSIPASIGNIASLTTFAFCDNYLSGAVPASLRSGVNLVNYPTSQGYDPVQCQGESGAPTPSTTTTTTTVPGGPTTTTTTTTTNAPTSTTTTTTTITPPARVSVCDPEEREWPALSVGQGGASIASIRETLFDSSATQAIYRWYTSRGEWARVLSTTGQFPQGRVISLRCVTTDPDILSNLNLQVGTQQTTLRENTNLVIAPEDLTRPEGARSSYLIAEDLTRCGGVAIGSVLDDRPTVRGSDSGITVITIRNADTGRWAISFPCNPDLEDVFIAQPENNYDEVSSISQGDIVYLRFITSFQYPDNYDIYWNSETSQYEAGTGPVADTG